MPEPRDPESVPRGLVLFAPGTPRAHRRRRLVFLAIFVASCASLTWPVYALFASPRPLVLGLPLPLVWVLLWMAVSFGTLIWLYRTEAHDAETSASQQADQHPAAEPRDPA